MKFIPLLPAVLLLLSACKADTAPETTKPVVPQNVEVTFNPNATATRGPVPAGSLSTDKAFRVWATKTATGTTVEEAFINDNTSNIVAFDNLSLSWRTTGATYYWPDVPGTTYDVTFYGLYPSTAPTTADIVSTKSVTFDSTKPIDGTTDVLYTKLPTSLTAILSSSSSAVPLQFHHALTQLAFKGKLSDDFNTSDMSVTVGSIRICNVNSTGTLHLDAATPSALWTPSSPAVLRNYDLTMVSNTGIVLTNTAQALTSTSEIPMVMPQSLTKWDPTSNSIYVVDGISTKTATTGCYLAIDCKMLDTNTNTYSIGDANTYDTIYVPFAVDPTDVTLKWEPGTRYTYILSFGSGYDSQGQTLDVRLIQISTSINEWGEGSTSDGIAA